MESKPDSILTETARYYSAKITEHGDSPQGVDWNGIDSQYTRFGELCRIIDLTSGFSVNDLGCGYGALLDYFIDQNISCSYYGYDVSQEMIVAASNRHKNAQKASFTIAAEPTETADFGIASGIFNVKQSRAEDEWRTHVIQTLDQMAATSRRGFAFNCLTSYSDPPKMRSDLFYADPCWLFDFCKRHYSRNVALLHDYGLYEFTILVRHTR
ncbi:MAG: class I SAM-dependent methyltransferase [Rhodocyclaceae bacterium]|nr:MAG: class I SAM-dependent methyltransferase [Rhodocyclaceae bacterium]